MDKYLFRGKPDIDQEWLDEMEFTLDEYMENLVSANYKDGFVYGQVVYSGKQPYIVGEVVESTDEWITLEYWIPVKPETVGQYTGLKDKSGVKIFEGDIVCNRWGNYYTPIFRNGIYMAYNVEQSHWTQQEPSTQFNVIWKEGCEVLGNIHDNPELLEVE